MSESIRKHQAPEARRNTAVMGADDQHHYTLPRPHQLQRIQQFLHHAHKSLRRTHYHRPQF